MEGEPVNTVKRQCLDTDGFAVNFGGYGHTSLSPRDALLSVQAPKVEVHLSNIFAREDYRHHSLVTSACRGMICGLGLQGYELAIEFLVN